MGIDINPLINNNKSLKFESSSLFALLIKISIIDNKNIFVFISELIINSEFNIFCFIIWIFPSNKYLNKKFSS